VGEVFVSDSDSVLNRHRTTYTFLFRLRFKVDLVLRVSIMVIGNGCPFLFLGFQVSILMLRNVGPFIIAMFFTF